jgi:hypothetical protein
MKVYYRMATGYSQHEVRRPRHPFDKIALADMCLRSFVEAFSEVKPQMHFILDKCGPEWDDMVKKNTPFEYTLEHVDFGTYFRTIPYQFELGRKENDYLLFQEDDYVWLKDAGQKYLDAVKVLEFVAPYDHMEFYTLNTVNHRDPSEIKLINGHHWRTIDYNTMTWGCHSSRLAEYWDELNMHGYWDKETLVGIGKRGAKIWSPIPSLCTHMHLDFLAPGIDWQRRFDELDK